MAPAEPSTPGAPTPRAAGGGRPRDHGPIVPQRACLVLPTTAEFDSRTYRIASALVARGHVVTVLARWAPGLPVRQQHATGYWTVRVPVSAVDGLPFAGLRRLVALLRRAATGRQPHQGVAGVSARQRSGGTAVDAPLAGRSGPRAFSSRVPRTVSGLVRLAAIALTVRSQARGSRALAPAADLYHGMAYMGIPIALDLRRRHGGRVVYDARDIYTEAANLARLPRPARALFGRIERRWARRADRVMTVNRPYAEVLADRFGVPNPAVVMNCSYRYQPPRPPARRFHERLGLDPAVRIVLYQGGFSRDRGIEQLLDAIQSVPGAVLVLMGYGVLQGEIEAASSALAGRVHILPAVPPTELLDWVTAADVVAMPIQPTTLNHRLTTPNKLFEAMAAGVPVVASDLPGMADIVRETGCGLLVDPTDPDAIATALRRILDAPESERRAWGDRGLAAAQSTYSWERQMDVLLDEYSQLTGRRW